MLHYRIHTSAVGVKHNKILLSSISFYGQNVAAFVTSCISVCNFSV